jgi:enoyl-CoA hydratase/carnithine racemase
MSSLSVDYQDTVAIARLSHGVTNVLDLELVNELGALLERIEHDTSTRALVLGSSNDKFFSIGFDIPHLFDLPEQDFQTFYAAFNRVCLSLYTLPRPTVAAITGHAVAGGCILALCCDYRFMADGKKWMGLNEIKLGVPAPYLADCVLRELVGTRYARDMLDTGDFYGPPDSLRMGLVDGVRPTGDVMARAIEKARGLGAWPQEAWAQIKQNRVEGVERRVLAQGEEKERLFVECWYSDVARQRLKETIAKFQVTTE